MVFELRPTFTLDLPQKSDEVAQRLHAGLEAQPVFVRWSRVPGARAEATSRNHFAWIAMPEDQQRLFSPWLQLSIMAENGGAQLFGRFTPRPAVWTVFALSYLFLTCVTFFSFITGAALWMLDRSPWPFWIGAGAIAGAGVLYLVSYTGQRLACRQMLTIRAALDACLGTSLVDGSACKDA